MVEIEAALQFLLAHELKEIHEIPSEFLFRSSTSNSSESWFKREGWLKKSTPSQRHDITAAPRLVPLNGPWLAQSQPHHISLKQKPDGWTTSYNFFIIISNLT